MLRNIKNEKLHEDEALAFQLGLIELKGALKVFDVVVGSGKINVSDDSKAFMEKFIDDYKEIDDIIKEKKNPDMEDVARFESMPSGGIWMLIKNVGAFGSEKERNSLKNLLTVSNNLNISAVVPESDRKILDEISYENENISSFSNFLEECILLKQTNSFKEKNKLTERIKENKVFKNNENIDNLNKDMKIYILMK
jgi:polyhydroxyalkanoate synthesis regulator phasin